MASKPFYEVGLHVGEVMSQGIAKAKSGNYQFILQVKILGLPQDESYTPHKQQNTRSIYWTITEGTIPFVSEKLKFLGYDGTSFAPLEPGHPNHHSFVGEQVDLWCKHEDDNKGGDRERWDLSTGNTNAGLKYEPLAPKEMRELDALFGKALGGGKKAASNPPEQKKETQGRQQRRGSAAKKEDPQSDAPPADAYEDDTQITDDDIPF